MTLENDIFFTPDVFIHSKFVFHDFLFKQRNLVPQPLDVTPAPETVRKIAISPLIKSMTLKQAEEIYFMWGSTLLLQIFIVL